MRNKNNNLNVVYTCDNNYAPYACVSICSLLENNQKFDEINIYIVLDNVSDENISKLSNQISKYNANFIPVDSTNIIEKIKEMGIPEYRGSYATNFRLFFSQYLRADVERFFYLDCDTLVLGDLFPIYTEAMEENCAYVVQDALTTTYKSLIGFSKKQPYFNSGVLLINVNNWKKYLCSERMWEHIKNERAAYCNPDQDLLNIVLKDNIKFIGPEYNFQPIHRLLDNKSYRKIYFNPSYYSNKEIDSARDNPIIIHAYRFLGEFPWHKDNLHPDSNLFDQYLKLSFQNNYKKQAKNLPLIMKLEKILFRFLPRPIFFRLFHLAQDITFRKHNHKLKRSI